MKLLLLLFVSSVATAQVTQLPTEIETDNTKRNIVYLYGHRVHLRADTETTGSSTKVYSRRATVLGVGYMRVTDDGLALGIACDVLKNSQLAIGLGF